MLPLLLQIVVLSHADMPFVARTEFGSDTSIIFIDEKKFLSLPKYMQEFVLAHEYGHVVSQDKEGSGLAEQRADCWAASFLALYRPAIVPLVVRWLRDYDKRHKNLRRAEIVQHCVQTTNWGRGVR